MTLTKAIEAARDGLKHASTVLFLDHVYKEPKIPAVKTAYDIVEKALAALPDKPKSENEVMKIIANVLIRAKSHYEDAQAEEIIRALKAANVLYVGEK